MPRRRAAAAALRIDPIQAALSVPMLMTSARRQAGHLLDLFLGVGHDRRRAEGQEGVGRDVHHHVIGDVMDERGFVPDADDVLPDRVRVRHVRSSSGDSARTARDASIYFLIGQPAHLQAAPPGFSWWDLARTYFLIQVFSGFLENSDLQFSQQRMFFTLLVHVVVNHGQPSILMSIPPDGDPCCLATYFSGSLSKVVLQPSLQK